MYWMEESDPRVAVYIDWDVCMKSYEWVVIATDDTDTALPLSYPPFLQALGFKEIWQQYGAGKDATFCHYI